MVLVIMAASSVRWLMFVPCAALNSNRSTRKNRKRNMHIKQVAGKDFRFDSFDSIRASFVRFVPLKSQNRLAEWNGN